MEFLEGKALSKHLLERYSKNPLGWNFTMYPSIKEDSGFFGAIVSGPEEVWQLKLDSIFKPNPLVLGAKVDVDPKSVKQVGSVPYGYRKIDNMLIGRLLKALEEGEDAKKEVSLDSVLAPINPVVPKGGEAYAEGPFIFTGPQSAAASIGAGQKELEEKLSLELRGLLRKRYQSYG